MSESVIAALIGLVGSLAASVIGAYVTLRIHNSQSEAARDAARDPALAAAPPQRRNPLVLPFTAVSLVLVALFAIFLVQTVNRGAGGAGTPTPTPPSATAEAVISPATLTPAPPAAATVSTPPAPATAATAPARPPTETAVPAEPTAPPSDTPLPEVTATAAQGTYGVGQPATLAPGVTLVINQMQVGNGQLIWQGTLRNDATTPYTFTLDVADAHFDTNAGPLGSRPGIDQGSNLPRDPVAPGARATLSFYQRYDHLPAGLATVDLVIDKVSGAGPFTFRRAVSLGTPVPGTPTPGLAGQALAVSPGVSLAMTQLQVGNGQLAWQGTLRNDSSTPFNFRLDPADVQFLDATGQPLNGGQLVQGSWPQGDVAPGERAEISLYQRYDSLPGSIPYVDLEIGSLSGYGPFVFRRPLSSAPTPEPGAPTPTPAVYQPGDKAALAPNVTLTITRAQVSNGQVSWQGTLRNDGSTPFNFRLDAADVQVQDAGGQAPNGQVQGNWPDGDVAAHADAQVSFYANYQQAGPNGAYVQLTLANISGYGPFVFRAPAGP